MTPRRWIVLTVRVPSEELTEELAEGLVALGGLAVEQDEDLLTTYVAEPDDPEAFLVTATERLADIAAGKPDVVWRWQDHEDWSTRWKEGLAPRRVGRRLVVTQPWNPVDAGEGDVVVVIEPSSAFGTGEHPTTRGALRLLESTIAEGDRVLDVGAGSGILSIAAVALGAGSALAVEADEGAMATAAANIVRAGLRDRIALERAVVDDAFLAARRGSGFDVIAANVLSGVLTPLLPALRGALTEGGAVILGGILAEEVDAVVAAAAAAGLAVAAADEEGEWWTGLMRPTAPPPG